MNIYNQRKIISALEEKSRKSKLLFLPCTAAKYLMKAIFAVCCCVDMALSDKDGNFLGIKRRKKKKQSFDRELARLEESAMRSPDDFTGKQLKRAEGRLAYRPLWQRMLSSVLAAAFLFMLFPEITASAALYDGGTLNLTTYSVIGSANITPEKKRTVTELNLSSVNNEVSIENGVISNMPNLTTITLGYSYDVNVGSGNFTGLAPDASVFVRAETYAQYQKAAENLSRFGANLVWDRNGYISGQLDHMDVTNFEAQSGIGCVVLKWTAPIGDPEGYMIYKYEINGLTGRYEYFKDISAVSGSLDCSYTIPESEMGDADTIYAIRAYNNYTIMDDEGKDHNYKKVYSRHFNRLDSPVRPLTAGAPKISASMSNNNVTIRVEKSDPKMSDPSYYVLYSRESSEGTQYSPVRRFSQEEFVNGAFTYRDPVPYEKNKVRSYTAVAFYDILGRNPGTNITYPTADESTEEYAVRHSNTVDINGAVLNPPQNPRASLMPDKSNWTFTWDPPADTENMKVAYNVMINGMTYFTGVEKTSVLISANDPKIEAGKDIVFSVSASLDGMTSEIVSITQKVSGSCVELISAVAGSKCVTLTFKELADAGSYTIEYIKEGAPMNERPIVISKQNCTVNSDKTLSYTVTGLENEKTYTFWMLSNSPNAPYSSARLTATPSEAPQPPKKVTAEPVESGAVITWDVCYAGGTTTPVDGYYITIKKKNGETVVDHKQVNTTSYTATGLENEVSYYAYVSSYTAIGESVTQTVSNEFTPFVTVENVTNLFAEALTRSIKVTWGAVKNATKYYLTRTDPSGASVTYDMGKLTSYEDKDIRNNVEYTYFVTAVREVDGKPYPDEPYPSKNAPSAKAKINIYIGPVQGLTATGLDGAIKLTWEPVENADGYYVECYSETQKRWMRIANVRGNEYTHTGLEDKAQYTYRVIPYSDILDAQGEPVECIFDQIPVTGTVGLRLPAPADFTAEVGDGQVTLKWSKVDGAVGYDIYVVASDGTHHWIDSVTTLTALHNNIANGTTITYCIIPFKYVDGEKIPGNHSIHKTVTIGMYLDSPKDVSVNTGDSFVQISWKKVDGAEGYVVYCYNITTASFVPVGIVTTTSFTHSGLVNGRTYTYMVAAYKVVAGQMQYSGYSLAVSATPNGTAGGSGGTGGSTVNRPGTGSLTNSDTTDYRIYITGTTPYGMSNSNVIAAFAEKGALNGDVDVRFTLSGDTTAAVQKVLNYYGNGVESFVIYPMDISLYAAGTDTLVQLNPGYYMTLTIPVPDDLLPYSDDVTVVHVSGESSLEVLPAIHVNVNGVDCMQFTTNSFSPFAFVVYRPVFAEDMGSGSFAAEQGSVSYQSASAPVLMCTYLPDIYRRRMRGKLYRIIKRK